MSSVLREIHQELGRLGFVALVEECDSCSVGLLLSFTLMPGYEDFCRVSEIGPAGRVTTLYKAERVLTALKQLPGCDDWYKRMRQALVDTSDVPIECVSAEGSLLVSTFPMEMRSASAHSDGLSGNEIDTMNHTFAIFDALIDESKEGDLPAFEVTLVSNQGTHCCLFMNVGMKRTARVFEIDKLAMVVDATRKRLVPSEELILEDPLADLDMHATYAASQFSASFEEVLVTLTPLLVCEEDRAGSLPC